MTPIAWILLALLLLSLGALATLFYVHRLLLAEHRRLEKVHGNLQARIHAGDL